MEYIFPYKWLHFWACGRYNSLFNFRFRRVKCICALLHCRDAQLCVHMCVSKIVKKECNRII
jgi:hypothetical protein